MWSRSNLTFANMLIYQTYSQLELSQEGKTDGLSPQGASDQWRFTPSFFETNPSFSLNSFSNQPPGYYTPTPGGLNTVYHNQAAGDLHTPGMAFQLGTPLSMPLPDSSIHAQPSGFDDLQGFSPQMFQHHNFASHPQFAAHPTSFAPSMLVHQDSGYGPMEDSPENDLDVNAGLPTDTQLVPATAHQSSMAAPPLPPLDKSAFPI